MVMPMFEGFPFRTLLTNPLLAISSMTNPYLASYSIPNPLLASYSIPNPFLAKPLVIALLASVMCCVGVYFLLGESINVRSAKVRSSANSINLRQCGAILLTTLSVFLVVFIITSSKTIAGAISSLSTAIPFMINKYRAQARVRSKELAWPEAIDSLVSALQSGLSITDSLMGLAERGPLVLRDSFVRIRVGLQQGEVFESVLKREKAALNSAISDQVFETLILAKDFGGRDSNNALRLLAEFIREDLDVVEEIRTKFGWIRNSAALATAAPWILLILLSSQSSTVSAFSTSTGIQVLSIGVVMTAVAYLWMERVGTLPQMARALR
jgi:tight adherence protein B